MFKSKDLLYHSIAILTVIIWGTTFVSTKILINTGLSPVEILLYRFVLAYFCILTIAHRRLWANCVKDEFLLFLSGLCGGSLYFIAENTALGITLASNVSLLICTAPIITTVLSHLFYKESLRKGLLYGSLVALFGVGLVVFNGSVLLKVNPLGDWTGGTDVTAGIDWTSEPLQVWPAIDSGSYTLQVKQSGTSAVTCRYKPSWE